MSEPTWYLLYGGSSPDGRGIGTYEGRTTDKKVALKHAEKIARDPYSTGYVLIITDCAAETAHQWTNWDSL